MPMQAIRSRILHCLDDPSTAGDGAIEYYDDGILLVEDGHIRALDRAVKLLPELPRGLKPKHLPEHLLIPGFIDTHTHYPQTEMLGAYGEQLLSWLQRYTFPTEAKFADIDYARATAKVFLDELLRNGTTTALVFATVHPQSVDAFFEECETRNLRMIAGKVCMDRNAPVALRDDAESSYRQSRALIRRWHGKGRLQYAITPRFAPTSSYEQLLGLGRLLSEHSGVYLQTHLAESQSEVDWVRKLFPQARSYLQVYEQAQLLCRRSVFAHAVHIDDVDCQRLQSANAAIAHCPTSNLFLGSGLFNLVQAQRYGVEVGLGTDIGAGTSFSMLRTMDEAYKIQQLRGASLEPMQAFYMATLGGARALDLESAVGNLLPGKEADFALLDIAATPFLKYRLAHCQTIKELVFALNTLADDRVVVQTYSYGKCVYQR